MTCGFLVAGRILINILNTTRRSTVEVGHSPPLVSSAPRVSELHEQPLPAKTETHEPTYNLRRAWSPMARAAGDIASPHPATLGQARQPQGRRQKGHGRKRRCQNTRAAAETGRRADRGHQRRLHPPAAGRALGDRQRRGRQSPLQRLVLQGIHRRALQGARRIRQNHL